MDQRLVVATLCRQMHWTYDEYLSQPDWLIETIDIMNGAEAQRQSELAPPSKSG